MDGNLVTGARSHSLRGLICDAIRIVVENGRATGGPSARSALFAFPLESGGERAAVLLADSLRRSGGELARSSLAAVVEKGVVVAEGARTRLQGLGVEFVIHGIDPRLEGIPLAEKAEAAAAAEAHALDRKVEVLVWLDRDSYVLREPSEFLLPGGATLAFRPVHHRRIGSRAAEPLGPFWSIIFDRLGVDPARAFPVVSTIDRERIRFYPNAGCLAVRSEAGLMAAWREALADIAQSEGLTVLTGGDPVKSLFLHQAVLAVTLLKRVPRSALRELSFVYNYSLHLHGKTPVDLKPGRLEDLVTVRYERLAILENALPMGEAIRRGLAGEGSR